MTTFEYVITFVAQRFFGLVPSPPLQEIPLIRPFLFSNLTLPGRQKNNIPKGLKIIQLVKKKQAAPEKN